MTHYDDLETRSDDERAADLARALPEQVARAKAGAGYAEALAEVDPRAVAARGAGGAARPAQVGARRGAGGARAGGLPAAGHLLLRASLPVAGADLRARGGLARLVAGGRFLHAAGIGPGDVVQNCFAYHLTPAGHIFESGARAVGAAVIPAGTGQTELQARAAHDLGATAYAGTPDFLTVILDRAEEMGLRLAVARAVVGGGALFPSLRQALRGPGHRVPAELRHRRSGADRLRVPRHGGHDRGRGRGRGDRAPPARGTPCPTARWARSS